MSSTLDYSVLQIVGYDSRVMSNDQQFFNWKDGIGQIGIKQNGMGSMPYT